MPGRLRYNVSISLKYVVTWGFEDECGIVHSKQLSTFFKLISSDFMAYVTV